MSETSAVQPREAHKHDPQNLWVRTATTDRGGRFSADFSIPRDVDDVRFVDVLEVERQAGIVFAHRSLGVSEDAVFLLGEISLVIPAEAAVRSNTGVVEVSALDHRGNGTARKARMHFAIHMQDGLVCQGTATARFLTRSLYARLRSTTVPPGFSARTSAPWSSHDNPSPAQIQLADPELIDHPTDHVPAMAVASAIERTARADGTGSSLHALTLSFHEYIEYHSTPILQMEHRPGGGLQGWIEQDGVTKAAFTGFRS